MDVLKSELGKVKGLGSAKMGGQHWVLERLISVASIPLVLWFIFFVIQYSTFEIGVMLQELSTPFNTIMAILFIITNIYHSTMGMKVVIEDYVHAECFKTAFILILNFISWFTAIAGILALVYLHVMIYEV